MFQFMLLSQCNYYLCPILKVSCLENKLYGHPIYSIFYNPMFLNLHALLNVGDSFHWNSIFFLNQGKLFSRAALQKSLRAMGESNFTSLGDDIFGFLNMLGWFWLERDSKRPKYLGADFTNLTHFLFTVWHLTHLKKKKYQVSLETLNMKFSHTLAKTQCQENWHKSEEGNDDNLELHIILTPSIRYVVKVG